MPVRITVDIDDRALARAQARLAKYEGRPFQKRMEAIFKSGAGLLVAPTRGAMAASGVRNRSGKTARSTSVRKARRAPSGYWLQVGTKPRTPQTHLLTRGHRIVTPGGRDTGQRSRAFPFLEDTIRRHEGRVVDFIARNVTNEGISVSGLGLGGIGGFR